MTAATWWTHEVRRCGKQAVALPVLAALLACVAAVGLDGATVLGRALLSCALPAAAALACAAVVAREPLLELHLSLPTPYPRTVARRLAWPTAVTAVAALALVTTVTAAGQPLDLPGTLLNLAGLTVLLSGGAVWATVRSGSAAPATGLVVAVVLAKLLLVDRVVADGAGQALPALLIGGCLTAASLRTLGSGGRAGAGLRPIGAHSGDKEA
ncbi:hypothetical protein OHA98_37335 [Streptomyces sp. NBC_00654]|uniref:hypothetical protein n=1 Tax=Streptomyces sp. NBC_00654 TaxID=2975799 RepID=UPI0022558A69|nr:hypothetical protein [Streptomyces sp. NBC_00654]MCX4970329.1 hypothetical protein [Streptomyces sp. NBC_00654]